MDQEIKTSRSKQVITVSTTVNAEIETVWNFWTEPEHIKRWNHASEDWHTTVSENDLRVGGTFKSRMEAKDGSIGFDFGGIYDEVILYEIIGYILGDGRKVKINFITQDKTTKVIETFEAEELNAIEMQQAGWQAILDNFKSYIESSNQ